MQNFRELNVWKKSHALTLQIYRATQALPAEERFGLTSQIRKSASSIGANLAEGCGRSTDSQLVYFLQVALGSAYELENHLLLTVDLDYLDPEEHRELEARTIEIKKMLTSFIKTVKNRNQLNPGA